MCVLCVGAVVCRSRVSMFLCILNYILYSIYLLSSTFTKIYSHMNVYMLCIYLNTYIEKSSIDPHIYIYIESVGSGLWVGWFVLSFASYISSRMSPLCVRWVYMWREWAQFSCSRCKTTHIFENHHVYMYVFDASLLIIRRYRLACARAFAWCGARVNMR